MRKAPGPIKIDGVADSLEWDFADLATDFFMITPMDTSFAKVSTDVRMCYDDHNIYLLAVCYKKNNFPYRVESLRRDFNFSKNDNFLVFIDPFDDQTNGFSFGANAAGAQWDGTMYDGGKVDLNWDNKWVSDVKNYPDRWIFEMAIPFKTIRYKKGIKRWGVNFSRLDITVAEKSGWAPVPRQFPSASLAYTGILQWDEEPPHAGTNISVIPYVLGSVVKDYEHNADARYKSQAGVDAKIGITSSLNLDLTVNPDFSQVEVDRQVTNLDRFELFFPERRQFFLENGDQFSNFGYATIRPFFSRRIGLNAPILFGARLSGKLDKNWRLGIMNMQTGKVDSIRLPAQNFTVVALQRKVFARSNFGVLMINKENFVGRLPVDTSKASPAAYNRNIGLEYNLASANNLWTGKAIIVKSFSPGVNSDDWVHAANLQYGDKRWTISWAHEYVGKNYTAEVGYVPRRGYIKINPTAGRLFFTKGSVVSHGPKLTYLEFFDQAWKKTDLGLILNYPVTFRNQAMFNAWVSYDDIKLLAPFDPTNSGKDTLARGTVHQWQAFGLEFYSKPQALFTYTFTGRYGGYFNDGTRLNLTADIGYRFQPYVSFIVSASYNDIRMPAPWNKTQFWLIGPRLDITFTNTLFFTTFVQYNNQQRNVNINTRFQWRYRPASDLFIVYTDNYFQTPFSVRNRAIVLKLNYWWNL
ncbi:carbohydrate binding family 9 domain-containing protein [Pollutibacter soli]|uniref:carbohydrate binding family 9 domain-containing protein n=1 Tax=Pollutibacter soli TaxID=3034157 RepID=UPI003013836D